MKKGGKELLARLLFLLAFVFAIFGLFWLGSIFSKNDDNAGQVVDEEGFAPSGPGRVALVEYSDFQCPACRLYYPFVKQLRQEFGDKLEVVYKHFPLIKIHKNANLAARAGEAAKAQDKFWEMSDLLFEKQDEWGDSGQALSLFTAYAVSLGLDQEKFLADIESDRAKDKVSSDYLSGVRLKVTGTPTFFLNGKRINNPLSYNEFKSLIEGAIGE